jgi:hypothetical protein
MSVFMRWLIAVLMLLVATGCSALPLEGALRASTTEFQVTPVKASPSELDDILEIKRWKFQLTLPQPNQDDGFIDLSYRLEVRQAGKAPRVLLASADSHKDPSEELEVIMFPIDYPDGQPQRWKVVLQGHGITYVIDTPVEASQGYTHSEQAKALPDGSFLLMEMAESGQTIPSPNNPQLVFSVSEGLVL